MLTGPSKPNSSIQVNQRILFDTTQEKSSAISSVDLAHHDVMQFVELKGLIRFSGLMIPLLAVEYSTPPEIILRISKDNITISQSTPCTILEVDQKSTLDCRFSSPVELTAGRYILSLHKAGVMESSTFMVAIKKTSSPELKIMIDDVVVDGVLGMRVYETKQKKSFSRLLDGLIDSYIIHEPEPGMVLVENSRVSGSAYFLTSLEGEPKVAYDQVRLVDYNETSMRFEYIGSQSGWVVIPVKSYPGWSLSYNDMEVETKLFKGVMPAVPVIGKGMIKFDYRPTQYILPGLVSLMGFLLLIVLMFSAQTLNQRLSRHVKKSVFA
ncbi:MAG: hypothetical protein AAES65_12350 [Candidatus Thiodiazotropha sp. (ex. Lucinoma kazani)]